MPELLQRTTGMKVIEVKDRTLVKPNCVYVIPSNKDMSILHGVLHLLAPTSPRGLRLPIDFFLHSLAQDRQEQSIGVILSGMGSDGTLGLRDIKEKGGAVFVQDPASAKYDGMPRSAIDSGLADMTGIERSRLLGRSFALLVSAALRRAFYTFLKEVFASQTKRSGVFELVVKDQPNRTVNIEARRSSNSQECRVVVVDITERKKLEREVLEISANEQRRIGNELHEEICQLLSASAVLSTVLARDLAKPAPVGPCGAGAENR